jgi:tRNA (uracil-5-)-methyltransferase TRM9
MYSNIVNEFDKTRTYVWNSVKLFLASINDPINKSLLEAGCGNGKNILYAKSIGFRVEGYDNCNEFVTLCRDRDLDCFDWDIKNPLDSQYDVILCVAVIHHLYTEEERLLALTNLFTELKDRGNLLVTVWSLETSFGSHIARSPKIFNKGDNQVPWKTCKGKICGYRYYFIYDRESIEELICKFKVLNQTANITIEWEEQNWILKVQKIL